MICPRPLRLPHATVGCGKCDACIINRRRILVTRLLLEARDHPASFFCTLTYDEEHIPDGGNLSPNDLQLFWKLLRRRYHPASFRYFAHGEYGGRTGRPHYHFILYTDCFITADMVSRVWQKGFVDVQILTEANAAYVAGYIEPGGDKDAASRSGGRVPEFTRQSLKPGIGYGVAPSIASEILTRSGLNYLTTEADIPSVVRIDSKLRPLGQYLKRKARECAGIDEPSRRTLNLVKRMSRPNPTKEEVELLEQKRRHSARRAKFLISTHRMKEKL
nr:MAG: replication initiator protein [Microvirus sp.]